MMIDELLEQQDDSRSIWSIPSLSSINPGSVVTDAGSTSFHSSSLSGSTRRSGPTKKASITSVATSSSTASSFDQHDDGKSVSSMVSEQTALRHRMRVILLEGIVENVLAETVDYLEPVVQNTSAFGAARDKRQRAKWGTSSHPQAEFTVCRPRTADESAGSSCSVSIGEESSHHHRLASRNPDDSVPLPPPPTHQGGFGASSSGSTTPSPSSSIRGDTIPCVPSRRSEPSATMTKKMHPRVVRRTTSYDFVPSKPRRTSSGDLLEGFHQ